MEPSSDQKIFYGWYVVGSAFLGNFMATGSGFYIFNAFMKPLCETRGWSRTELNAAPVIGYFLGLLGTLFLGYLLDKIGPRPLMVAGTIISGIAFALLGMTQDIWIFYLFFALLVLGNSAMSQIVANTAVSNWFVLKRGRAMGVSTAGISLSGVILPYLAMVILERTNIKISFFTIAGLILLTVPFCYLFVRNRPEDYGLTPDGTPSHPRPSAPTNGLADAQIQRPEKAVETLWTPKKLVRTPAFWKVGLAFGLTGMAIGSVMFQLAPRFSDVGFSDQTAMMMMALTALMGTWGKYAWGSFCDRFETRKVVTVLMLAIVVGLALNLISNSMVAIILFIIIFGFAMGGFMSTFPIMIAEFFGRDSFARVYKYAMLFFIFEMLGYLVMGRSYDLTGSYNSAFMIFICAGAISVYLVFSVKWPEEDTLKPGRV
jgi:sugar phosphate permease